MTNDLTKREKVFIDTVRQFYADHKRADLPWRQTSDPYQIVVSEIMLQQTQVERVISKYQNFLARWPDVQSLSSASLGEVLSGWQGLGYNRRAKMLHACAQYIVVNYDSAFPDTYEQLLTLPGIGPYTAGAVMAFAYNKPVPIIETNIRTVYLYHFLKQKDSVTDKDIVALVDRTLDQENPREWYWALMDYGSYLKKVHGNLNVRTKAYKKQSMFAGSDRQIRGAIIRVLTTKSLSHTAMQAALSDFETSRVATQLNALLAEGMIKKKAQSYTLP